MPALNLQTQRLRPEIVRNIRKEVQVPEDIKGFLFRDNSDHLIQTCRSKDIVIVGYFFSQILDLAWDVIILAPARDGTIAR